MSFTSLNWSNHPLNRIGLIKTFLSRLSLVVRKHQLQFMLQLLKPTSKSRVLDMGLSPREDLPDTNYFEQHYPYLNRVTAASAEDCHHLHKKYPQIKIIRVLPWAKLPFKNKQFDISTSWATLEHVGNYHQQAFFLNELLRVSKHIFVTTPYRHCIYEPHTGFFFLHWLPLTWFRSICRYTNRRFWSDVTHINPLSIADIHRMQLARPVYIKIYRTLGLLPTHMILTDASL